LLVSVYVRFTYCISSLVDVLLCCLILTRRVPCSTLFPYTTLFRSDVHSLGLENAQGLMLTNAWYWDMNDDTRKFAQRFMKRVGKDRKSTRLNSSHVKISYAVFCLKKKSTLHNPDPLYTVSQNVVSH